MDKWLKEQKIKALRRQARRDYDCSYFRVSMMRSCDLFCMRGRHAKWSAVSYRGFECVTVLIAGEG